MQSAILGHGGNVRRYLHLDSLTPEQAAAIKAWSEQVVDSIEARPNDPRPAPSQPET